MHQDNSIVKFITKKKNQRSHSVHRQNWELKSVPELTETTAESFPYIAISNNVIRWYYLV